MQSDLTPRGKAVPAGRVTARRASLRVLVPTAVRRSAAQIARDYTGRRLETVVAAFVADLAVAARRPGSWEYERVTAWLESHVWEVEPLDQEEQ